MLPARGRLLFRAAAGSADFSALSTIARSDSLAVKGLGSSEIHAREALGYKVKVPPFLKNPKTVSIIGAPLSYGQPIAGTDQGPKMLREAGLIDKLVGLDWRVNEMGDLHFDPPSTDDPVPNESKLGGKAKNCFCVGQGLKKISDRVFDAMNADEFPLILGGDHSIAAGSISGVLRKRPETGIIWVDAHGDLNTPLTSPSGNIHGMPLGLSLGLCNRELMPGFEWMNDVPLLRPEQIVFVGLRDLDDGERNVLREHRIKAFTMQHIDRWGVGGVMEMALEYLRAQQVGDVVSQVFCFVTTGYCLHPPPPPLLRRTAHGGLPPLHLSYDIDAVDPDFAPSTGTVVRGGLNFREAHYVAEAVSETGMLGSCDMVEVNPMLKPGEESDLTVNLGMRLITSVMGSRIL